MSGSTTDGGSEGPSAESVLGEWLERSRTLGFLGKGDIEDQVRHSSAFVDHVPRDASLLDLGSGGGVPGLVVGVMRPDLSVCLMDSMQRRCRFLSAAVEALDLGSRITVVRARAEDLARQSSHRHRFDVVTARSFGPPATTLECAVGFLRGPGATVLVSEPPGGRGDRWPAAGVRLLGMEAGEPIVTAGSTIQLLTSTGSCDERFPRRSGVPAKRPLF